MSINVPIRIYHCPECGYDSQYRWVLKNHLIRVHDYGKRQSTKTAMESEYWLNPHYIRVADIEDRED